MKKTLGFALGLLLLAGAARGQVDEIVDVIYEPSNPPTVQPLAIFEDGVLIGQESILDLLTGAGLCTLTAGTKVTCDLTSLGGGSGAPSDVNYLVGTASGGLSAEIAVGTTPGGELGNTWASPTIDDGISITNLTLVTPVLGTPQSGVATNLTGLPVSTGLTGAGTGVLTALGANVTGSGGIALATSPTFTTPNIGTPSAGTLTNTAGLPTAGTTFTASDRVHCRDTASGGTGEECTSSAVLDMIGSTRGSFLTRGASAWGLLTPGAVGTVPVSAGSGADPAYGYPCDPTVMFCFKDDFGGPRATATSSCADNAGWTVVNTATGQVGSCGVVSGIDSGNNPGTPTMSVAAVADVTALFRGGSATTPTGMLLSGGEDIRWLVRVEDLSANATQAYTLRVGMGDVTTTGDPSDGIWWSYTDSVNSGNWIICATNDGTPACQNTSTAVAADTWYALRILCNAAATSCQFFVNDVEVANSPLTSELPTAAGDEFAPWFNFQKTVGSTARVAYIDYFFMAKPTNRP